MSFFNELKRRNVFRVAAAYIVVGWLILQVAEVLVPALRLPDWVLTATLYFLMVAFFPAVILAWAFELTPEGIKLERDVDRTASGTARTGKKLNGVLIALLSIAVIYLGVDKLKPDRPAEPAADGPQEAAAADPPRETSIAVLPFANMSVDAANEYFADGVSEEILNALSRANDFKVAGRTSSFAFKGRNEDLRLIGETLDVTHILEGSVRKAGNTVRVTAQLIAVDDGYHLWSETWDRQLDDIFAIQDEIAAAILLQLRVELTDLGALASTQTDPRAYEKYLAAKQLMYTRAKPKLDEAQVLLDEALALDDGFAPAWAMRGILAGLLSTVQLGNIPFDDAQQQIKRYAERALALDGEQAEAWAGLGLYHFNRNTPESLELAIQHLERALEINPAMLDAANWLQSALLAVGRQQDALALLEAVVARDPLYRPAVSNLNFTYRRLNQTDKMRALLDRLRPFWGGRSRFDVLTVLHINATGDFSAALPVAQAAHDAMPDESFHVSALGRTLFWLNDWEGVAALNPLDAEFRSVALDQLGRRDEARVTAVRWFEASRNPTSLFHHLAQHGEYEELMQFVEQRWTDVEGFDKANQPIFGFGHRLLLYIAQASLATGRETAFEDAMRRVREEHDRQLAQGVDWAPFHYYEAMYWTLAGDRERAVDHVEMAVDRHGHITPRFSLTMPMLEPLEGLPRYEAAQARSLENLNRERVEAGYAPLRP